MLKLRYLASRSMCLSVCIFHKAVCTHNTADSHFALSFFFPHCPFTKSIWVFITSIHNAYLCFYTVLASNQLCHRFTVKCCELLNRKLVIRRGMYNILFHFSFPFRQFWTPLRGCFSRKAVPIIQMPFRLSDFMFFPVIVDVFNVRMFAEII